MVAVLWPAFFCGRPATEATADAYAEMGRVVFQNIEAREYERIFDRFCYPDPERQRTEEEWLRQSVDHLESTFGLPSNFRSYRGVPSAHFAAIGAGSADFWDRHQASTRYTMQVDFSKVGQGWIQVDLTDACGPPRIKTIMYALPSTSPSSKATVDRAVAKLVETLPPSPDSQP